MITQAFDWRARQLNPPPLVHGKRKHKLGADGRVVVRRPEDIDGIVVHQTACTFGPFDDAERRHERALGVACHALAFRDGNVVIANPLLWYVQHGNGFNARSLGLEIEGLLPGLVDDPATAPREDLQTTWNGRPDELTGLLVDAACLAIDALVELALEEGIRIRYVWAHRQSSASRRSDPGEGVWRRVVLEHAVARRGLETQPALVLSGGKPRKPGRPIPIDWDPAGVGKY